MNSNLVQVDIGIGLEDSELRGYNFEYNTNILKIEIEAWDTSIVTIQCINPILFIDQGGDCVQMFCENSCNTELLDKALKNYYAEGKIPLDHPFKLYQLLDIDDHPIYEIICEKIIPIVLRFKRKYRLLSTNY